ncbi:GNAT family N-acetyltransferase [Qipengyuania sp. JC766]|uniref:GNAT family N-acetyltransferase n=1 Tax=Qipengyuania sp. JC766 TaxID=3232139 RepID=UPI0034579332
MTGEGSDSWHIRLAREDDAAGFARIANEALQHGTGVVSSVPPDPDTYRILITRRHCLSAEADGHVIGFAACRPATRELHLEGLAVAKAWRRHGIGGSLVAAAVIDAANSGFQAITAITLGDEEGRSPFLERYGFVRIRDLGNQARLHRGVEQATQTGLPRDRLSAMIRFL